MIRRTKKSGSSLLLVILLISGISVVIFASQRLGLVQFSQSNREEDNIFAYYAAKAGIEDGLARVRFNRDTEIGISTNPNGRGVTAPESQARTGPSFYFGLNSAKFVNSEDFTHQVQTINKLDLSEVEDLDYDTAQQYYKLDVLFRDESLGVNSEGLGPKLAENALLLEKDQPVTLTGFVDSGVYFLRYIFEADKVCTQSNPAFIQLEQIKEGTSEVLDQRKVSFSGTTSVDSQTGGSNWQIRTVLNSVTSVRITPYYCPIRMGVSNSKTPGGSGLGSDRGPFIDSLKTLITSTGFYGNARATLIAEVDRTTNTLIGVYDYNLYSGGNISPPGGGRD